MKQAMHQHPFSCHENGRLRDSRHGPLVGYMRISKADGSQVHDLQRDALLEDARLRQTHASPRAKSAFPGSCRVFGRHTSDHVGSDTILMPISVVFGTQRPSCELVD